MIMKRFVSWAAVSSLPQAKKISIEDQLLENRLHVERHGGQVIEELVVPGESRDIVLFDDAAKKITAYARFKELVEAKAFDVFIFLNHGRLGRDSALALAVIRLCNRAGIVTYSTESPPATLDLQAGTHTESLMDAIKSVGAQQEIVEMQRRNAMGMAARVRRGDFPGQTPWPWIERYSEDGKKHIEIDEQGRIALLTLRDMYLKHRLSSVLIASELQTRGFPPPGRDEWTRSTVRRIVEMPWLFAGYVTINKKSKTGREMIRARSRWAAIWTDEDAQAIEDERHRRYKGRGSIYSQYRFSQVIFCAVCNKRMGADRGQSKHNGKRYYNERFRCSGNHEGKSVMAWYVEEAIKGMILYIQSVSDLSKLVPDMEDRTSLLHAQASKSEDEIRKLKQQLERVDEAWTLGLLTPDRYRTQVDRINGQLDNKHQEMLITKRTMVNERRSGDRIVRLEEIKSDGMKYFEMKDDIATANKWFIDHFRVWVKDNRVIDVETI